MTSLALGATQIMDEHDWVDRARAQDLDAIAAIYEDHHAALCSFAKRLLGDNQAAEDLVHDVFVLLPRVLQRFEPGRSLRSFLLAITANEARHHVRSAGRRRAVTEKFAREPAPMSENPEQSAERRLLAEALRRALDTLATDERIVFILCEIEGRGSRQVAEILSAPEGTVRRRLFHARQKLRALLDEILR